MIDKNDKNSEKKEIKFEVEYLLSLTTKQRFKKLFGWSDFVKKLAMKHGYNRKISRRTGEVIQRA